VKRTVSLPEDLIRKAEALAARDNVSLEKFLAARLSEQLASLDYLNQRAARASRAEYEAALSRVSDTDPKPHDRL